MRKKASPTEWRRRTFVTRCHPFARLFSSIVRFLAHATTRFFGFVFEFGLFLTSLPLLFVYLRCFDRRLYSEKGDQDGDQDALFYRFNSGASDMRSVTWP